MKMFLQIASLITILLLSFVIFGCAGLAHQKTSDSDEKNNIFGSLGIQVVVPIFSGFTAA